MANSMFILAAFGNLITMINGLTVPVDGRDAVGINYTIPADSVDLDSRATRSIGRTLTGPDPSGGVKYWFFPTTNTVGASLSLEAIIDKTVTPTIGAGPVKCIRAASVIQRYFQTSGRKSYSSSIATQRIIQEPH
ncbi:hypothetical protein F5883DRAFT_616435 [Diaporthe sp. PMI_573]|nr:hypothetical protein F5883DRAFT_616435 [Diaporthaceae sp. PMI_573]